MRTLRPAIYHMLGLNPTGDVGPWTFYTDRRKGTVMFVKAPPDKPPSLLQLHQRNRFRMIAATWRNLSPTTRATWQTAATRAQLRITGFNLFVWFQHSRDTAAIETIERAARLNLQ